MVVARVPALVLGLALQAASPNSRTEEAERLAQSALSSSTPLPQALAQARKALALTADFEPLAYVKAGRKGELVEDAYLAARAEYRRHRARIYGAMGESLTRSGRPVEAARYLRRAVDLDALGDAVPRLARALARQGRGREALDTLLGGRPAELSADLLTALGEAADAAGTPSAQAELDRFRLLALAPPPEFRDGPLRFPERTRLSTGEMLRFDDVTSLVYVADPGCRSCSADIEALTRLAPASVRVLLMAAVQDEDQALRSVATTYRRSWPYVVNAGPAEALGLPAPCVVLIGRGGFSVAVVKPSFALRLPPALEVFARRDLAETAPRSGWNRVAVERRPPPPRPALLASGLAPGEDEPAPAAFAEAVAAFDDGRPAHALKLFEALRDAGDGWLLGPEARLDRALCLAALGRREEARLLLLKTSDSRFQEAVDQQLERIGSATRR